MASATAASMAEAAVSGRVGGAGVVDVDALVGGSFGEVDGVGRGGGDAVLFGDDGELAENGGEGLGEVVEAEVGEPEAQVKLIGHESSLRLIYGGRSTGRVRG